MEELRLTDSPRLYVTHRVYHHLPELLHTPFLQDLADRTRKRANQLVRAEPLGEGTPPAYQSGTRQICNQLEVLTAAWLLTRKRKYRRAAIRHLAALSQWRQISCEANVTTPADTVMPFCLSYGELSAVVAVMYDCFRPDMTAEEKAVFNAMLDKFLLRAARNCLDAPPWWANKSWSNWNGVCAGGMGILALALYDDRPEARALIGFVEQSLGAYFQSFVENGGGCHEGTGYWNYGMNYAMRYLLSWEHATGQKHRALEIPQLGHSLFFPLDFTGISFGDNDGWGPTAFFFLLARRLGITAAALQAAVHLKTPVAPGKTAGVPAELLYAAEAIPDTASMQKLQQAHAKRKVPVARVYQGMDWAALADDEAFPRLRLALRGGSSKVAGHGMLDLLSIRCRVNGALMITDQQDGSYMPTTFSRRGNDLYGRSAASKSTLFIDGLGCMDDACCDCTQVVQGPGWLGIRIDASHIYLRRWKHLFTGRLVMMVDKSYWIVVDRLQGMNPQDGHWMESRFHTSAACKATRNSIQFHRDGERLNLVCASLQGGTLLQSTGMPSQPQVPATTIYRWMSTSPSHDHLHVVALTPGTRKPRIELEHKSSGRFRIRIDEPSGRHRSIHLTSTLQPA